MWIRAHKCVLQALPIPFGIETEKINSFNQETNLCKKSIERKQKSRKTNTTIARYTYTHVCIWCGMTKLTTKTMIHSWLVEHNYKGQVGPILSIRWYIRQRLIIVWITRLRPMYCSNNNDNKLKQRNSTFFYNYKSGQRSYQWNAVASSSLLHDAFAGLYYWKLISSFSFS